MAISIDLSDRVAVITGGNSGIGLATALLYAQAGASVVIASRREAENEAALAEIKKAGSGKAIAVAYDALKVEDAEKVVAAALTEFGHIDVCMANAGGVVGGSAYLTDLSTDAWRGTIALNLDATFYLWRAASKPMIDAKRGGSLIATSSVAAIQSSGGIHYAAAKGGINSLVMILAAHLGRYNIRVNSILPGMTETPPLKRDYAGEAGEDRKKAVLRHIPLRRFAAPEEMGQMALYLGSDNSRFVTGQAFVADGGMTKT